MDNFRQKIISTRKQTGLHADDLLPWTECTECPGRELLHCQRRTLQGWSCHWRNGSHKTSCSIPGLYKLIFNGNTQTEAKIHNVGEEKNQWWYWYHGIWKLNSFPFPLHKVGASLSLQGICTFLPPLSPWNLLYSKAPTSVTPKIAWYKSKLEQAAAQFWRYLFVFCWIKICIFFPPVPVSEKYELCQQSSSCLI